VAYLRKRYFGHIRPLTAQVCRLARPSHGACLFVSPQAPDGTLPAKGRSRPLVTVVLPTCDRLASLRDALRSIIGQRSGGLFDQEIVVVGNAAPPPVARLVDEISKGSAVPVRYVYEPRIGVSHARNRGISEANGDWIAFFDDDQVADPDWLRELLLAAHYVNAPCVGGRITLRLPDGAPPLSARCRNVLGEQSFAGVPFICTDRNIPSSGNLMVARHVFRTVATFDPVMRRGGEDSDLVRRIRSAGIPIMIAPSAVVEHVVPLHRTTAAYLRSVSHRIGAAFAYIDLKEHGRSGMALRCVARSFQTLLMTLPACVAAAIRRDAAATLDGRVLVWRYLGYVRGTFFQETSDFVAAAPPQERSPLPLPAGVVSKESV